MSSNILTYHAKPINCRRDELISVASAARQACDRPTRRWIAQRWDVDNLEAAGVWGWWKRPASSTRHERRNSRRSLTLRIRGAHRG